jgi:putative DNA primase/helicase
MSQVDYAIGYLSKGYSVIPCNGKKEPYLPTWKEFQARRPKEAEVRAMWRKHPNANIGIVTGAISNLTVVDCDSPEAWESLGEYIPASHPAPIVRTPSDNHQIYFKYTPGLHSQNRIMPDTDIKTDGGYVIAPPSVCDYEKGGKRICGSHRWHVNRIAPPAMPPELADELEKRQVYLGKTPGNGDAKKPEGWREELFTGVPEGQRNDTAAKLAGDYIRRGLSDAEVLALLAEWNTRNLPPLDKHELQTVVTSIRRTDSRKTPAAERKLEATPVTVADAEEKVHSCGISSNEILYALDRGEDGDAELFIKFHRGLFCYDHAERRWFEFTGQYWKKDRTNNAIATVSRVIDAYSSEAKRQGELKHKAAVEGREGDKKRHEEIEKALLRRIGQLHDANKKADVLVLAAAGPGSLGISGEEWDKDFSLIGCPNGVIELKTGLFRPGRPADYIRTVTNAEWTGIDALCSNWERTIHETFKGNIELVDYVQRLFGYALTGAALQHIIPILWGIGRNGKGTILENLKNVLGSYAYKADPELLLMQKFSRQAGAPNTAILSLRGKRIVWCSETSEGRRMDAARVKELCGGDTLNARGLYGKDHVEFRPSHLLLLITNFKPKAPANDYALWQRIRLIPFELSFVAEPKEPHERKADLNLLEKLKSEASGILAWIVRGCLKYQHDGLTTPDAVKAAGRDYQAEEDTIGQFLAERCILKNAEQVKAGELYSAYDEWCRDCNLKPMANTSFGKEMTRRGFDRYQKRNWFWLGVGLVTESEGGK